MILYLSYFDLICMREGPVLLCVQHSFHNRVLWLAFYLKEILSHYQKLIPVALGYKSTALATTPARQM